MLLTRDRPQQAETLQRGHALRFTEHRTSGPAAQAVWLRSLPFFNHVFPGSRALLTQIFSSISRKKIWGKKISQGGPTPKIFDRFSSAPKGNAPAKFHSDISKTVASSERQLSCTDREKKKNKVADVPPKPEVRPLSSMYRWIELGALNFSPETVPLRHFRFLNYGPKTVDFVEISERIKT